MVVSDLTANQEDKGLKIEVNRLSNKNSLFRN